MPERHKEISSLIEKMTAIMAGNYDVEAENTHLIPCWERLKCDKLQCPAYGKFRCWSIAGTFCHGQVQGNFAKKIGDCKRCVVYRESCGDDVGELLEAFNLMVRELKYHFCTQREEDQKKAVTELNEVLENMTAIVAHATRNPLNSIGLTASYLKKTMTEDLASEFLSIIEEEVKRIDTITNIFLDFSSSSPPAMQACNVGALAQAASDIARSRASLEDIMVTVSAAPALPLINTDPAKLLRAIVNLLDNAIDATRKGGKVTVTATISHGITEIAVADCGQGIRQEELAKIFKPFYSTKVRGLGLGLAITKRLVGELGGEVVVECRPQNGSVFKIKLPASLF